MKRLSAIDRAFYATKANAHPDLLREIVAAGLGLECVSMGEVRHALDSVAGLTPDDILFTPNFAPRDEYAAALELGVHLTIDGLHPLSEWPELFKGREVILRINPDRPRGHHAHVKTAGPKAKFGIARNHLPAAREAALAAGAKVIGLHAHAGSGVTEPEHWREIGRVLAAGAEGFEDDA